jgi:hypothetical protein
MHTYLCYINGLTSSNSLVQQTKHISFLHVSFTYYCTKTHGLSLCILLQQHMVKYIFCIYVFNLKCLVLHASCQSILHLCILKANVGTQRFKLHERRLQDGCNCRIARKVRFTQDLKCTLTYNELCKPHALRSYYCIIWVCCHITQQSSCNNM